ncbi:hypothetical protein J6590_069084 [Homalodisca vitripennis]|nr:hypothetical protein J6590_069084 [Homalodisca vitripennis]
MDFRMCGQNDSGDGAQHDLSGPRVVRCDGTVFMRCDDMQSAAHHRHRPLRFQDHSPRNCHCHSHTMDFQ